SRPRRVVGQGSACFPSNLWFPAKPPAPTLGRGQRTDDSEPGPKHREQQTPPPPISTMSCRLREKKTPPSVVGKKSSSRGRSAPSHGNLTATNRSGLIGCRAL